MRNRALERAAMVLLCAFLLLGQAAPLALAYVESDDAFTIRITPPANVSGESAPVEILVTDNAGDGFKTVQVKKGKNQTWQLITSDMEQRENRYYGSTMITENCTVYVRVTGKSGKFYENSKYIEGASQPVSASTDPDEVADVTPRSRALTPEGTASVLDNATSGDGKEFFTFTTPAENVFYLVIDKQRQDKNVYFLNAVTEKDLMALAQTDESGASGNADSTPVTPEPQKEAVCICKDKCVPGEVNADCPVCVLSWKNCKGVAHDHDSDGDGSGDTTQPQTRRKSTNGGSLVVMLIAALGAGGAGYYFKIYKPKKELEDAEDLDELTEGAEQEETVNEDEAEQDSEMGSGERGYPDYADYADGYGDGPEYPEEGA